MAVVVVNGEGYWPAYLPGVEVVYRRLQDVGWVLRGGDVWVIDRDGGVRVDGVLWRVGAVRPHPHHRVALEILRHAGIPCVNDPRVLLRCFDRLSMLAELREAGLPVVPFDVAVGDALIRRHGLVYPFVVKVGSHHAGYGKVLVRDDAQWSEIADLLFAADDYATVEPYVEHARDVRCLLVGDRAWAMERRGRGWRANVDTIRHAVVDPPPELERLTRRAAEHLGAELIAVDALEQADGTFVVLESNETPGLSGFPEDARNAVAGLLLRRLADGRRLTADG